MDSSLAELCLQIYSSPAVKHSTLFINVSLDSATGAMLRGRRPRGVFMGSTPLAVEIIDEPCYIEDPIALSL